MIFLSCACHGRGHGRRQASKLGRCTGFQAGQEQRIKDRAPITRGSNRTNGSRLLPFRGKGHGHSVPHSLLGDSLPMAITSVSCCLLRVYEAWDLVCLPCSSILRSRAQFKRFFEVFPCPVAWPLLVFQVAWMPLFIGYGHKEGTSNWYVCNATGTRAMQRKLWQGLAVALTIDIEPFRWC